MALWSSGTHGRGGVELIMRDNGNLDLIDAAGKPVWSTNTALSKYYKTPAVCIQMISGTSQLSDPYMINYRLFRGGRQEKNYWQFGVLSQIGLKLDSPPYFLHFWEFLCSKF